LRLNVFDVKSLERWHAGRVVLIGDAAHAASPTSGQGASMALEDAVVLAMLMRDHISATGGLGTTGAAAALSMAFAAFQAQRYARVEGIIQEGRDRAKSKVPRSLLLARIRQLTSRLVLNLLGPNSDRKLFASTPRWS
jgi:2-polyprenyl-6-methoxyphenol hydroxylase-like FAD-dependent oxidoreductase